MQTISNILSQALTIASKQAGYNETLTATPCAIESMGDYQCVDAMKLAKIYHKKPFEIASEIISFLQNKAIKSASITGGYINIVLDDKFLSDYVPKYIEEVDNIVKKNVESKKIIVDYGGANVAKPLHVGHLRSANIGESIKRICKYVGCDTLGDVHLGDWGLQMGMVISEIKRLHPDLPYFAENYTGKYPKQSPVTIKDLETLYPQASKRAKENEDYMKEAKQITYDLQHGHRGYFALWKHILDVSVADLKKNYNQLNVHFDLWLGESDTRGSYDDVINFFVKNNYAYESEGALIVDIKEDTDTKEIPPFMLKKSDGSVLYSTTDLATLIDRYKKYNAQKVIYVVDNRQELHFVSLFRVAKKYHLVPESMELTFAGFGTMNGKDGKPYKTRDGGVMKLEDLINEVKSSASQKSTDNDVLDAVAISALKFADLSILRTKDYVFDPDKFCSFEGKTGPYLLYTLTRAKSIIRRVGTLDGAFDASLCDKKLLLTLINFCNMVIESYKQLSPNILCDYAYTLANDFNSFYTKTSIIGEKNLNKKYSMYKQTIFVIDILQKIFDLLAIKPLEKM